MSSDQIPAHVRAVLTLFEDELGAVRFGDVDREVLVERVAAFEQAAAREAEAYGVLQDARRELDRALFRLEERAERATEYARIYARDHEPLAARLEEIAALRPGAKTKPKRRRKTAKPKAATPAVELPFEPGAVDGDVIEQVAQTG